MPMNDERWLLPAGVEEVLPPEAARMERLRRALLDLYSGWGYELVIPPFIDYLESLLTGTGHDLDLHNLPRFITLPALKEVSIGHALTVDAIRMGLASTVAAYQSALGASPDRRELHR